MSAHLGTIVPAIALRNTIAEACHILKLSRCTVYARIKAGLLHVTKDGKRSFITSAEISRYLASCEEPRV